MTIWGPLTDAEYEVVKRIVERLDAEEANFRTPYKDHPHEKIREIEDMRAKMRAAIEGYEATHRENT